MGSAPIRVSAKVLIKYRAKRLLNQLSTGFRKKKKEATLRGANARKGMRGWLTALLLSSFIFLQSGYQAHQIIQKTDQVLGNTQIVGDQEGALPAWNCAKSDYEKKADSIQCVPLPVEGSALVAEPVAKAIALELLLLFLTAFLLNIASKELTAPEWDMEWLVTLPIPLWKLLSIRLLERTVVNPAGFLLVWPFMTVFFWRVGTGFSAIPLGLLGSLAILFFEAVFRTIVDTGLRMVVSPSTLKNMQAVTSLVASASLLVAMSIAMDETPFLLRWSVSPLLNWVKWTPMGLLTSTLTAGSPVGAATSALLLVLQIGLAYLFASKLLMRLLRFGIVAGGSREGTKRESSSAAKGIENSGNRKPFFSPLQLRELKLLVRDRNFMVQTLVLPIFITGMQFFISRKGGWREVFLGSPTRLAATAFGAAAYSLLFSSFQVLNAEGKALWILYTFPSRVENLLRQKVYLWLCVALLYPVVLFGIGIYVTGFPSVESMALLVVVLLGVLIYGTVAACLGVFASDPLAEDVRHKSSLEYTYLYMILAGFYTYAIFAKSYWDKLALLILSALMALALFQKARDHLPFLLDPTEAPKARVSLSDGLIAALMFFVFQGISAVFLASKENVLSGRELLIAFSIAGAVIFISLRIVYWQKKTLGVPRIFGKGMPKAIGYGLISGVGAGAIGIAYINVIARYGFFVAARPGVIGEPVRGEWWIFALAVIAAPLFEEFIFRGIIFKGLLRTWALPTAALASAAIFAIVHPPMAVIPVFGLAVIAALSYARTNLLITPMVAHAVYNFIVVLYQSDLSKMLKL